MRRSPRFGRVAFPRGRKARGPGSGELHFWLLVAVIGVSALFGGSARADTSWLLLLRPLCCFAIAAALLSPGAKPPGRQMDVPLLLLAGLAAAIGMQLLPLPPAIWTALPGHARYVEAAELAGIVQPWRTISLTPWLTWNALLALLPVAAALVCLARIGREWEERLVVVYLGVVAANLALGVLQVAGAMHGPPLPYRYIHEDSAIGFFTNRNHAAVLLATGFPVLRLWVELARHDADRWKQRAIVAAGVGLAMVPVVMATGSRSGMMVALPAIVLALAMAPLAAPDRGGPPAFPLHKLALWTTPPVIAGAVIVLGKARSLDRILGDNLLEERRWELLPTNLGLVRDFFPFGSGFGSFDQAFRVHEPDWALTARYFNNAHNDLLELLITGGLPALLLLAALTGWAAWRALPARHASSRDALFARAGAIVTALWFAGSLTDYPLRTPFAGAMFALALFWLAPPVMGTERRSEPQ